jgi:hypothetical protein
VEVPPDFKIEEGHLAACWLFKDAGVESNAGLISNVGPTTDA